MSNISSNVFNFKCVPKGSKYKYVEKRVDVRGGVHWIMRCFGTSKEYDTEREAAIAVDKKMISMGKEPVNILVRK